MHSRNAAVLYLCNSVVCLCQVCRNLGGVVCSRSCKRLSCSHARPVHIGWEFVALVPEKQLRWSENCRLHPILLQESCFFVFSRVNWHSASEATRYLWSALHFRGGRRRVPIGKQYQSDIIRYHWYWTFEKGADDYHDISVLMRNTSWIVISQR